MGLVARTNRSMELAAVFTESAYADPNLEATRKTGKAGMQGDALRRNRV